MVKAPEYQAMDDARQDAIPRAYRDIVGDDKRYKLKEEAAVHVKNVCGPRPRPTFHVIDRKTKEEVATFFPNGYAECHSEDFKEHFDRMVGVVEIAANNAYRRFTKGITGPEPEGGFFPE